MKASTLGSVAITDISFSLCLLQVALLGLVGFRKIALLSSFFTSLCAAFFWQFCLDNRLFRVSTWAEIVSDATEDKESFKNERNEESQESHGCIVFADASEEGEERQHQSWECCQQENEVVEDSDWNCKKIKLALQLKYEQVMMNEQTYILNTFHPCRTHRWAQMYDWRTRWSSEVSREQQQCVGMRRSRRIQSRQFQRGNA